MGQGRLAVRSFGCMRRLSTPAAVAMLLMACCATAAWPQVPAPPESGSADLGVCGLSTADRTKASVESCTRCHDGSIPGSLAGMASSHPVDLDYAAAQAQRPGALMPASGLPPEVTLVEGKLTCTTCHDGRSTLRYHLSAPVSPKPSRLCLSCHDFR
ncbi:MAG: cytochrome c3 family protein [Myxococcaceae bacterium]